jgi:exopolysaccharide production protein ExoZ
VRRREQGKATGCKPSPHGSIRASSPILVRMKSTGSSVLLAVVTRPGCLRGGCGCRFPDGQGKLMPTIVSVQALRAIAALAVALCHFDELRVWLAGETGPYPLDPLASGVDLFFVISGFVMVYSSGDLFGAKGGAATFLARRVARVVPPYWLVMLAAIPLLSLPHDWESLAWSYLFFPFRSADNIVPVYGVGWTLNFEMYFYALFAALIFLRRSLAVPALCASLVAIVVLGQWFKPSLAPLQFWSDPIILEFVFGMVLALLYINGVRLAVPIRGGLVVAGIAAIGFFETRMPPSGFRVVEWGFPAAMIFAGTVLGRDINFGRLRAPVEILGNSSYALYLTHSLMTAAVLICWPLGLNQYPKLLVLSLAVITVQLFSIFVFYVFEQGIKKFLKRAFTARLVPDEVAAEPASIAR